MAITVSHNATSLNPALVLGYSWDRQINNLAHDIIGSSAPAFTFRPAGAREGRFRYFCLNSEDAQALAELHADVGLFSISDDQVPAAAMTYVPQGTISVSLDDTTRVRWVVEVGFREVV